MAKRKTEKSETPARSGGWRSALLQPKIIVALLIGCSIPMIRNMSQSSEKNLIDDPQYQVERSAITLKSRPDYVPEEFLSRTWESSELPEQFSILEPGLAERIGKSFENSAWVRGVEKVKLSHPRDIEVALDFRRPVALVRSAEGYYPIDKDGVLLPPTDFSAAQLPQYPVIENVQTLPQGPAGTHWGDLAVWGAARLIDLLIPDGDREKYWTKYELARVRVYGKADLRHAEAEDMQDISYRLITLSGSEVIWGVAPDVTDPTEPDAETKLERLSMYHRDFGGLHSEQGPIEIDLRRWKDIARRPLDLPQSEHITR